ncbi:MAG: T9SS type A sorting domain-containing protein [Bacteroidales bacterium]|jgi:hypothetical protein|nr:T9SS type A sorting domain-containing protein [Bacteroidales bacterium]
MKRLIFSLLGIVAMSATAQQSAKKSLDELPIGYATYIFDGEGVDSTRSSTTYLAYNVAEKVSAEVTKAGNRVDSTAYFYNSDNRPLRTETFTNGQLTATESWIYDTIARTLDYLQNTFFMADTTKTRVHYIGVRSFDYIGKIALLSIDIDMLPCDTIRVESYNYDSLSWITSMQIFLTYASGDVRPKSGWLIFNGLDALLEGLDTTGIISGISLDTIQLQITYNTHFDITKIEGKIDNPILPILGKITIFSISYTYTADYKIKESEAVLGLELLGFVQKSKETFDYDNNRLRYRVLYAQDTLTGAYKKSQSQYYIYTGETLSIAQNTLIASSFIVYPNPATSELKIKNVQSKDIENVEIIDILGHVQQSTINNQQSEIIIDISRLPQGVYFIKIGTHTAKFSKF